MKSLRYAGVVGIAAIALAVAAPASAKNTNNLSTTGGVVKGAAKGAAVGAILPGVGANTGAAVGAVSGGVKVKSNNGLGNGDQPAPGNSLLNNRAENQVGDPGHASGKTQHSD